MDIESRIKLFANEINEIKDKNLKEFANKLLESADDYFFNIAASTTGKYHPQFDLGEGGLVRHTKVVMFITKCECVAKMMDSHTTDLLIIAALAHDIKKLGNEGSKYTVGDHPTMASEYVESIAKDNKDLINDNDIAIMTSAIKSHMGQWGEKDGQPIPSSDTDFILHVADYIASRKEFLSFDFKEGMPAAVVTENVNSMSNTFNGNPKDYVMPFGKYRDKRLEEVRKDYLEWIAKQTDFANKETQDIVKLYLSGATEIKKEEPVMKEMDNTEALPF